MHASGPSDVDQVRRRLGSRIGQARREAGLTQYELAERIGATLWQVVKVEDGDVDGTPMLPKIAGATGWSIEALALEHGDEPADLLRSRVAKLEEDMRALTGQLADQGRRIAELTSELESDEATLVESDPESERAATDEPAPEPYPLQSFADKLQAEAVTPSASEVGGWEQAAVESIGWDGFPESESGADDRHLLQALPAKILQPAHTAPGPPRRRRRLVVSGVIAAALALAAGTLVIKSHDATPKQPAAASASPAPASAPASATPTAPAPKAKQTTQPFRPPAVSTPIRVLVLNGNAVDGAAAREAASVKRVAGYRVTRVGNADHQDYAQSVVMYRPGLRKEALELARRLKINAVSPVRGVSLRELGPAKLVVVTGLR
jgi:transcriptional regulator with XRE-family HTH domain